VHVHIVRLFEVWSIVEYQSHESDVRVYYLENFIFLFNINRTMFTVGSLFS